MGDEGSYLPNSQTYMVIVLLALSLLFWHFINIRAYHSCRYEFSSPYIKELYGYDDHLIITATQGLGGVVFR